jgi:hypothetical protein
MSDQNLLSRTPPCFGRHVKPLVPAAFATLAPTPISRRVDVRQVAGRKNNCRIYHNMMKNMLYRPHLVCEKGRKKKKPINAPSVGVEAFLLHYTYGERTITHHAGPVWICACNRLQMQLGPTNVPPEVRRRSRYYIFHNHSMTDLCKRANVA